MGKWSEESKWNKTEILSISALGLLGLISSSFVIKSSLYQMKQIELKGIVPIKKVIQDIEESGGNITMQLSPDQISELKQFVEDHPREAAHLFNSVKKPNLSR